MSNITSIAEQVFKPDAMEWEESEYQFLTGLLMREGGDKRVKDEGGWTRYGISERAHGDEHVIWDLTEDQAREIYKEQYIHPSVSRIGKNNVAFKFVDMNVNMGWSNATKVLQRALGIEPDGNFGPATADSLTKAIHKWGEDEVISMISEAQLKYYKNLQTYDKYPGWDKRAEYNPLNE